MKIFRRLLPLLCALSLLLTGCGGMGETDATLLLLTEATKATVTIGVEKDPGEEVRDGLRLFAERLSVLGEGSIALNILYVDDPYESYRSGEVDAFYIRSDRLATHLPEFYIYTSPFYFRSYDQITMTLNSPTFHTLTQADYEERYGLVQLGAIFRSSTVLFSKDMEIVDVYDFADLTIAGDGDRATDLLFTQMGARVTRVMGESRFDAYAGGSIDAIECSTQELGQIFVGGIDRPYLTETFHRTDLDWFWISAERYASLTPRQQAAVQEASAYLISTVEETRMSAYRAEVSRLEELGVQVSALSTQSVQQRAQEILYADKEFYETIDWQRYDAVVAIIR